MTPTPLLAVDSGSLLDRLENLPSGAEHLLGGLLQAFPVPSPRHVSLLLESIGRISAAVPWLATAAPVPDFTGLIEVLGSNVADAYGRIERLHGVAHLTGGYLPSRSLVGKEPAPAAGPESLRAALLVCALRWHAQGRARPSALDDLGAAIRGITEYERQSDAVSPVTPHLPALGAARTLEEFLEAADVLLECGVERLEKAWARHFKPSLLEVLAAIPPSTPEPVAPNPEPEPEVTAGDDDEEDPLSKTIRAVLVSGGSAPVSLEPGEPVDEVASSSFLITFPGIDGGEEARKVARYLARQSIWSGNYLLLTNHPDVLPLTEFREVVRVVLEELAQPGLAKGLRSGLLGLLLQALTGRTPRTLAAIHMQTAGQARRRGACGLSLAGGFLELDVFWRLVPADDKAGTGFFEPDTERLRFFEPVATDFRLPLPPEVVRALKEHVRLLGGLQDPDAATLESLLRGAARHVAEKAGFPIILGQVRRSFAVHFYQATRDLALTQLVSADTLGQSDAPLHYYSPRRSDVAKAYWGFLEGLLQIHLPLPAVFNDGQRVGAASLLAGGHARRMAGASGALLNRGIGRLIKQGAWREVHAAMVTHLASMFLVVAGHRPVDALFSLSLADLHLGKAGGAALFRDKVHDAAHDPRFAALAPCLVSQVWAYLSHLRGLAELQPALATHVDRVLMGREPLMFGVSEQAAAVPLKISTWRSSLPEEWQGLPLNWGRTWIRTRGVESGLPAELAALQLGHLEAVGYPFSHASPTVPQAAMDVIAPHLEVMARQLGWRVRAGIPGRSPETRLPIPSLQSWKSVIVRHEAEAREQLRQWRQWQAAKIAEVRERAEADVLSHPVLVSRGIAKAFSNPGYRGVLEPLALDEAEALRDVLYEDAGDDVALGIARSRALRRVLRRVNKRLGNTGKDPGALGVFRRALDNAFIPGMMVAVRQLEALRLHAAPLGAGPQGDWRDFNRACARVAYVLAVFGFMEHPDQIEGAIRRREAYVGPASLPDTILVPWGDQPGEVVALRNLAAVALARLAKRYPGQAAPDRGVIGSALREFLPEWALRGNAVKAADPLALLCECVGVANRFELSPAARFALDPVNGSTGASIDEQVAFIDGDPVGTIVRNDAENDDEHHLSDRPVLRDSGTGSARSQYRALCAVLPNSGSTLELPLTGVSIPASQLFVSGTRQKVLAEVDALLAERRPEKVLRPVVRLLALWVRKMLVEGTPAETNPADSTIRTYLTRIGGTIVELIGNSSLIGLDEVDLEEVYLAAIRVGQSNQGQAASAVLEFHRCCQRHADMPDVDFAEIRSHLHADQRAADAKLILPQERVAIIDQAQRVAEHGASSSLDETRVQRQAAAALPLFAWGGARRSEVLGLRQRDVWGSGRHVAILLRRNRSRRLKTRAAKRMLRFDVDRQPGISQSAHWIQMDGERAVPWSRPTAYVFSPESAPASAEGRHHVAESCLEAIAAITQRRGERIHRFRHLVATERLLPLFLSKQDGEWMRERLGSSDESCGQSIVMPRDLMERVVTMGHVDGRTTLRCYLHLAWLLRSMQDEAIGEGFMARRELAFASGVTVNAVDRVAQAAKGDASLASSWVEHIRTARTVPGGGVNSIEHEPQARMAWTAQSLDHLFRRADRMGLERAATILGAGSKEIEMILVHLRTVEFRMGRRLFRRKGQERCGPGPRRQFRRIHDESLDAVLTWFDGLDPDARQLAVHVVEQLVESANPFVKAGMEGKLEDIQWVSSELADVLPSGIKLHVEKVDSQHWAVIARTSKSSTQDVERDVTPFLRRAVGPASLS